LNRGSKSWLPLSSSQRRVAAPSSPGVAKRIARSHQGK
jgi:hypothetical protein